MSETNVLQFRYDEPLEQALSSIADLLKDGYGVSKRTIGLLLLQGDPQMRERVKEKESDRFEAIQGVIAKAAESYSQPLSYVITVKRQQEAKRILSEAMIESAGTGTRFAEKLSRVMMNPWSGIPILLLVIYFGLYQFVGVFGAGTLVGFLENTVFGEWLNPRATDLVNSIIPVQVIRDLFIGEFGILTLGLTYTFALILPIVSTFFIVFSIIEDSGYLPRLAMLIDRLFKAIGLSGRAVIPMVLGFGCDTMATIVTRTQETTRERVLTTLLLALAIPCSAQLGVILAILSGSGLALLIWGGTVALVLLLVGFLASRLIPGKKAVFYMEVPLLRMPKLSNVLAKTFTRLQWYFLEVMPIFVIASVLLWAGKLSGVFDIVISKFEPVVTFIGLPPETATAFLYGFFRRDFGAAGLYDLNSSGALTGIPLLVSGVTLTLFVPCIAQFSVMGKERGFKTALAIAAFSFTFAFAAGYTLNAILTNLGVSL